MEQYNLVNFALEAFGKYVSCLFENLLRVSQDTSVHDFDIHFLQPTFDFLDKHVVRNMIPTLAAEANEVVVKVLYLTLERQWKHNFENAWQVKWERQNHFKIYGAESYDAYSDFVDKSISLAAQIAAAASHPSVKSFRCINSADIVFQKLYIQAMLRKSKTFKELELGHLSVYGILPPLQNLVVWSCKNSTDEIIEYLAESATNLRLLNISVSNRISDKSVDSIIKFRKLSYLNIRYTSISSSAKRKLFQKLKNCEDFGNSSRIHLNFLGLTLQHGEISLIPECFPNLTSLEVVLVENINLKVVQELTQLSNLLVMGSSSNIDFSCIKDLVQEIGSRLTILKLRLRGIEFKFISRYCTQLKTFIFYVDTQYDEYRNNVPGEELLQYFSTTFQSVEILELFMVGDKAWRIFPFVLLSFENAMTIKFHSEANAEYEDVVIKECLLLPLRQGIYKEVFFNNTRIQRCGEVAVITSDDGYSITVNFEMLDELVKHLTKEKVILDFGKNIRVFPMKRHTMSC